MKLKYFIFVLFIIGFMICNLKTKAEDFFAKCNDEGFIECPGLLQPTCDGKKKPSCITIGLEKKPSCYIDGSLNSFITFSIDDVKCFEGKRRIKL